MWALAFLACGSLCAVTFTLRSMWPRRLPADAPYVALVDQPDGACALATRNRANKKMCAAEETVLWAAV